MKFSDLTTIHIGGHIQDFVECQSTQQLSQVIQDLRTNSTPFYVIGQGSNTLACDDEFQGCVIKFQANKNWSVRKISSECVHITAWAGCVWDELVQFCVENQYAGVEMLSGIPGTVGAAPVQNIGAYGRELSDVFYSARVYDWVDDTMRTFNKDALQFAYRTSLLKQEMQRAQRFTPRYIVCELELELKHSKHSAPIAYEQLASALNCNMGQSVSLTDVRHAVLALRTQKGMVYTSEDLDSHSAGSFFMNPLISQHERHNIPAHIPAYAVPASTDTNVQYYKYSAAALIEASGIHKGFKLSNNGAQVSSKHVLALCNHKHASYEDICQLMHYIQQQVLQTTGIQLQPEPVIIDSTPRHFYTTSSL